MQENVTILLGEVGATVDARRSRIGRLGAMENEVLLLALLTSERTGHYSAIPSLASSITFWEFVTPPSTMVTTALKSLSD
jgi:hypothetical protein